MALTHVGSAEDFEVNSGNPSITLPGGVSAGDIVFLFGGHNYPAETLGPSTSGYTNVATYTSNSFTAASLDYKVMGGTPDSTVDCYGPGGSDRTAGYHVLVYSGADTTTPMDTSPISTQETSGVHNPTNPAITTATDGAEVVISLLAGDNDTGSASNTDGYGWTSPGTLLGIAADSNGSIGLQSAYVNIPTAGTVTPGAWRNFALSGIDVVLVTWAIRPAAGAPGVVLGANPLALLGVGRAA